MRTSGILMPVTSLPSPWGIGTLGAEARAFVDFLARAGVGVWQVLPIGPTGFGDSPYQSFSSYAGNPYLIDLDDLSSEGLLGRAEYAHLDWGEDPGRVDYGLIYRKRFAVLRHAVRRLLVTDSVSFLAFSEREHAWLDDYALFMALKEAHGGRAWGTWEDDLKHRAPLALAAARSELNDEVLFWKGVQCLFFRQWDRLRAHAHAAGVEIMGDLPIYVAEDSADVWAHPDQFQLDGDLAPIEIAGCPPDGFSVTGQLWGNPLFAWDRMRQDGYRWWGDRIAFQLKLYDILRIDHFRGFDSYFAIPAGAETAAGGRWRKGPGMELFDALQKRLGTCRIVAEDLGFLTPSVRELLERTGFPGMKVLEFAFDSRDGGDDAYLPYAYPRNSIAYIGTHDNDTALGWLKSAPRADAALAREYLGLREGCEENWGMMRAIWASASNLAVVQMQDLLGLGSEARMNVPSTVGSNWTWRALPGFTDGGLAERLRHQLELFRRVSRRSGALGAVRPCVRSVPEAAGADMEPCASVKA